MECQRGGRPRPWGGGSSGTVTIQALGHESCRAWRVMRGCSGEPGTDFWPSWCCLCWGWDEAGMVFWYPNPLWWVWSLLGSGRVLWGQPSFLWGSGRGIRSAQFSGSTKRGREKKAEMPSHKPRQINPRGQCNLTHRASAEVTTHKLLHLKASLISALCDSPGRTRLPSASPHLIRHLYQDRAHA